MEIIKTIDVGAVVMNEEQLKKCFTKVSAVVGIITAITMFFGPMIVKAIAGI